VPIFALAIGLVSTAQATTYPVGPNQIYVTLGDALSVATDGDRLEVDAGTYIETLDIDIVVEIVSLSGAGVTNIRGTGNVIDVSPGADLTLDGFTLSTTGSNDRAFDIRGAAATLSNVYISGFSRAREGGAMRIRDGATVTLTDCNFDANESEDDGGHIYVSESILNVTNSDLTDAWAEDGGGIYATESTVNLNNVTLDGNAVSNTGGSLVLIDGSTANIENSDLYAAEASSGYAGHIYSSESTLNISNTNLEFGVVSTAGGGLYASESTVVVENSTIFDNEAYGAGGWWGGGDGGGLSVTESTLTVNGSLFSGNSAEESGGAIYAEDSDTTVSTSTLTQNEASGSDGYGGALRADGGSLEVTQAVLSLNSAGYVGGAIRTDGDAGLAISGSTFSNNDADGYGGALHHGSSDDLEISSSLFQGNTSDVGGAIRWRPNDGSAMASIIDSTFQNNESTDIGGVIAIRDGGSLEMLDNSMEGNTALEGGAIYVDELVEIVSRRNLFCGNSATSGGGGAVFLTDVGGGTHSWTNNRLVENVASEDGGAIAFDDDESGDSAEVVNNNFLGNLSSEDGGGISGTPTLFVNNVLAWTTGGSGLSTDGTVTTLDYNDFYDNTPGHLDGTQTSTGANSLDTDPLLMNYTQDGDCSNDTQHPQFGSPLVDAGDVSLFDPDGSRSDIGAFGGEHADPDLFVDADADGWVAMWDCDDNEPAAYPGNTEVPYDGIDNDCLDGDECDLDGDGFDSTVCGGTDCDDTNAAIHVNADEVCDGGIDNDCDGAVDDADSSLDTTTATLYYTDADGDGHGGLSDAGTWLCEVASGFAATQGDCDDSDAAVNPDASEVCDGGIDNNCNGAADDDDATLDASTSPTWYADTDGDGFGDETIALSSCAEPGGHVAAQAAGFDCNDNSADYHPYADESDCTDPNDYNCDGSVGYADEDADGWAACAECDDSRADTNPAAPEVWYDGIDQDCDGSSDYDADQDGHNSIQWGGEDCDDEDPAIHPEQVETPYDGMDQDCDGVDLTDVDGDGFDGSEAGGEDCDDTDADIHPDAEDLEWDGIDQDCDGEDGPGEGPDTGDTGNNLDTGNDLSGGDLKAGGCGCTSSPDPATTLPLWLLALAWIGGRTRRPGFSRLSV